MDVIRSIRRGTETGLGVFKYLLGAFMILEGIATAFSSVVAGGPLGFLYSSRFALVFLGIIFAWSGAVLIYGKIRKSKKWTGKGLLYIYLCFVFATIIQILAYGLVPVAAWLPNAIGSFIVGTLWLRWKFKTEYINPNHFKKQIVKHDL